MRYTYLLTPWRRLLLEKLTGLQLVKKLPAFHGTRICITTLTSVRHLSIWASPIQSIYTHCTSWRSVLILSAHLRLGLPSGSFPPVSPPRSYTSPSPQPYVPHAQPISFSILSISQFWVRSTSHLAPHYAISSIPPLPRPSLVQIFSSTPCSHTPSASFPPAMSTTKFHTHTKQQAKLVLYILIFKFLDSNLEDKILHRLIASISWLQSALNFFHNRILLKFFPIFPNI